MIHYFLKRVISLLPVWIGITIFAFFLGLVSPGDPVYLSLTRDGITEPSEAMVNAKRAELGLDLPYHIQYVNWINRVIRGDFGKSIYDNEEIKAEMLRRMPVTLKLAFSAFVITVVAGLGIGAVMAATRDTILDRFLRQLCTLMVSIPGFCMAIILIAIFSECFHLLPTSGMEGVKSFIMPSLVLSMGTIGTSARLSRSNFIGEISKQYVLVASAKGMSKSFIGTWHIFKNAMIPIITFFGLYFAGILGGSAVIESIFALPGMGSYVIDAIYNRDYFIIQAFVLLTGTIYVLSNLLIDMLYFLINPRMKQGDSL
ncbi:ABC transporter permease [Fusibacter paucivorans]|uniref:ABC transporter permease n=1 Tax=Fusibacter paucivorans TaxID=76009 RepID=A0ABS5PUY2_9FIRM|nr:ABC transporter permease [Fusibacter paucivorans]MBS7527867.1 ABC transporter permease [Fusibacter paucivorans]